MTTRDRESDFAASTMNAGRSQGHGGMPPRIDVTTLMGDGREVRLVYKDIEYRLRLTSNDKLILNK